VLTDQSGNLRTIVEGSGYVASVQISPFSGSDFTIAGFVIHGRWPSSTQEWTAFLALAVGIAARPGRLRTSSIFRAIESLPQDPDPTAVGLVMCAGPAIGDQAPRPGDLAEPHPPALLVLHPPAETVPSTPEIEVAASGAVLLPGMPHLGLEHRAGWAEAEPDGTVTKLLSRIGVNPGEDPDLAVLAQLCAA